MDVGDSDMESLRASSISGSSFSSIRDSSQGSAAKPKPSKFNKPNAISGFKKHAMQKQLNEERDYRAQFEDKDSDLHSFHEERSDSPHTPVVKKSIFFALDSIQRPAQPSLKDNEEFALAPTVRQNSENFSSMFVAGPNAKCL